MLYTTYFVYIGVTTLAATGKLEGFFKDIKRWDGAIVGTSYEQATDEIDVSVIEGYSEMTTDNNFVVLTIKIVNNSGEPYNVSAGRFLLICDGAEYEYDADAVLKVDNAMWIDDINPGITKEYKIVYETPTTTDEREYVLKIKPIGFSDKDSVYITLK